MPPPLFPFPSPGRRSRVAIVGSGVSGLVAAWLLQRQHDITLFEAEDWAGGHAHTVDVPLEGRRLAVDTGFITYNLRTYPRFSWLLRRLGVETQPTDMSFGVRCERTGLEWSSRGIGGLLAQPRNLWRPAFRRMVRDALRFHREAPHLAAVGDEKATLGEYLSGADYSREFVEHYLVPMGAAIWSASPARLLEFPAVAFVRFFANHGLLDFRGRLPWRVIRGGSRRYIDALVAGFRDRIRLATPVWRVHRQPSEVVLETEDGGAHTFDRVVLAVHSDQALGLLAEPTTAEREVLGSIRYQPNEVILHGDASLLPHRIRARASWNVLVPREPQETVQVSYDMNRLQGLGARGPVLVTLNAAARIDPARIWARFTYHHPVLDGRALAAQKLHGSIDGTGRVHYSGAWWGYGFHEDGVASAFAAVRRLTRAG